MELDQTLIAKTKNEIKNLRRQKRRLTSDLENIKIEYKRNGMLQRIEGLDKKINEAETALDNYIENGTYYRTLIRITHSVPDYTAYIIEESKTSKDKHISTKRNKYWRRTAKCGRINKDLYNDLLWYMLIWGVIIVFIVIVVFVCWKIIAFFSDTPFGTDYGEGLSMFVCLILAILYIFARK